MQNSVTHLLYEFEPNIAPVLCSACFTPLSDIQKLCLINQNLYGLAYHFLRDKSFFSVMKDRGYRKVRRLLERQFVTINTLILCWK